MTNRITASDLRKFIAEINRNLAVSGSNYYLETGGRNGYQALDLCYIDEQGAERCMRNLEGGTSRECMACAWREAKDQHGRIYGEPTRRMAKKVLSVIFDFETEFHQLSQSECEALATWAKFTKYRKPANANGSTARYFFEHLAKKVKRCTLST